MIAALAIFSFACNKEEKLTIETQTSIRMYRDDTDTKIEYSVSIPFANIEFRVENPEIISIRGTIIQALSVGSTKVTLVARYDKQTAQAECVVTVLEEETDNNNPSQDNNDDDKDNKEEDKNNNEESETNPPKEDVTDPDKENPNPPNTEPETGKQPDDETPPDKQQPDKENPPEEEKNPDTSSGNSGNQQEGNNPSDNTDQNEPGKEETALAFSVELIGGEAIIENNVIKMKAGTECVFHIYTSTNSDPIEINSVVGISVEKVAGIFHNNFTINAEAFGDLELFVNGISIGKLHIAIID